MPQRITGHTELIGLIASPIRHSRSPMMHNTAFETLGLDYVYMVFEVGPEDLKKAVEGLRALGVRGFNVSMPLKQAIIPYLDEIMPVSRMCRSVNTVINENGRLIGTSTDGEGFTAACREAGIALAGQKITLLGAGGAGTAVAMQLGLEGAAEISIFNRDDALMPRARENAAVLNEKTPCRAAAYRLEDTGRLREEIASSAVLINATGAGFGGQAGACPVPDGTYLHPGLAVADVIYEPEKTALLELAESVGCKTMNGLGMMLYQGAASFKLWTGRDMPMDAVRDALGFADRTGARAGCQE